MKTVVLTFCPWEVGGHLAPLFDYYSNEGQDSDGVWWAFIEYFYLKNQCVPLGHAPHEPTDMELEVLQHGYSLEGVPLSTIRERFMSLEHAHRHAFQMVMYNFSGQYLDNAGGQWEGTAWSLPVLFLVFDDTPEMIQQSLL